ncbi:MAG: phosphoribosyl-ATP diphosphatase [Clostridia bacterium]|nr:phosphoribosyl-ATP diphosphatase [Clostridia bacterium]
MAVKTDKVDVSGIVYGKDGLITVITQDYESGEVLLIAKMNAEAIEKTFDTSCVHYFNEKTGAVEKFGAMNGNTQKPKTAYLDGTGKTLLLKVCQTGNADAENKTFSTFSKQIKGEYKDIGGEMLGRLQRIVEEYKKNPEDGAYTSFLFARGVDRIAKKVGEEAVEFVIASKNEEKTGVINEAGDLLYHVMVLLSAKGVKLSEVCAELCKRNR